MVTRAKPIDPFGRVVLGTLCWLGALAALSFWGVIGLFHIEDAWPGTLNLDWLGFLDIRVVLVVVILGVPCAVVSLIFLGRDRRIVDWMGATLSGLAPLAWYFGMVHIFNMIFG